MADNTLDIIERLNRILDAQDPDPVVLAECAVALSNRVHDVFHDLGLPELTPKVRVVEDDILFEFPLLGRTFGSRSLNRLEDIARELPKQRHLEQIPGQLRFFDPDEYRGSANA